MGLRRSGLPEPYFAMAGAHGTGGQLWLTDARLQARSRELGTRLLVKMHTGLMLVGDDAVGRQIGESGNVALDRAGVCRDQRAKAFTQPAESSHD